MSGIYNKETGRYLPEYISVISSTQCARIRIDDIEILEQEGRKLHIITAARDYSFYENMNSVVMSLADRAFYRPMKGLIINFDHVMDIKGNEISFYSGQCVTMGKNSIGKTRKAFKRYLMKYPPYSLWEPANKKDYSIGDIRTTDAAEAVAEKGEEDKYMS